MTMPCDDMELKTLIAQRLAGISEAQIKELNLYKDCTSAELVKSVLNSTSEYTAFQKQISEYLRKGIRTLDELKIYGQRTEIADDMVKAVESLKSRIERTDGKITKTPIESIMLARMERYNGSKGNLNVSDGYNCSLCNNRGNFMRLRDGVFEIYDACKCMKVRDNIYRLWKSGLENTIKRFTFESYKTDSEWQANAKASAMKYAKESQPSDWFYIGGAVGSGKTHLCTAICREMLLGGMSVRYMLWATESAALKALVTDEEAYGKRVRELKTVDVLYIDDFFKPTGSENAPRPADIRLAYEILNERYVNNKRTIISSEWLNSKLLEFDEATGSRIYERSKHYCTNIAYADGSRNYRLRD